LVKTLNDIIGIEIERYRKLNKSARAATLAIAIMEEYKQREIVRRMIKIEKTIGEDPIAFHESEDYHKENEKRNDEET
jgi:hypothetical protein